MSMDLLYPEEKFFSIFRKSLTPKVYSKAYTNFRATRIIFDTQVRIEPVLEFNHVKS